MIRLRRKCFRQREQRVQMLPQGNEFGESEGQKSNQCGENTVERGRGERCEGHSEGKQGSNCMKF